MFYLLHLKFYFYISFFHKELRYLNVVHFTLVSLSSIFDIEKNDPNK